MSLQLGAALREAGSRVLSRTGAVLFAVYLAFMVATLPISNTMLARVYERAGLTDVSSQLPAVLDVPLSVAVGGYLGLLVLGMYLSLVATRTFVAGTRDSFPDGALTRNVPLAMANLLVGGLVYGALVAVGLALLFVPGIIAYIAFLFMLPFIAVEDRNFVAALRSSYRLSKGHWLMLFVLMVVLVGASGLVGAVSGFVFGLLLPVPLTQLASVLIQAPITIYLVAVIAVVFDQLRDGDERDSELSSTSDTASTPA